LRNDADAVRRGHIVRDTRDMEVVKRRVVALAHELHAQGERGCEGRLHPFFGTLTGAQWGITQFKHLDHHLRQFEA
jgi:Protein of unknown function (DUF1569)